MPLSGGGSNDPNVLVGVAPPDFGRGYADDPLLASWEAKARRGEPVTLYEHNAAVAMFAWCQSVLSYPAGSVPRFGNGIPFPFGATRDGKAMVLGSTHYTSGDTTLPTMRPSGAAALPPPATMPPSPPSSGSITLSDAQRRNAYDAATRCLENLRLLPESLMVVPAGAASPAGLPPLVWPAVVIVVAGAAIYAGYRASTANAITEANASVERVRVSAAASKAIVDAQLNAKVQTYAMQLAHAQATGTVVPLPDWASGPIQIPDLTPEAKKASGWSTLEVVGAVAGGMAATGLGVWGSTLTTRDRRPW